jgi:hypothetical protein
MLLRLALVGLLFLLSNSSRAQKNTLRLWVDTLQIDTAQTDVLLNVKFKLDVQRPPVNFRGYKAEIDYGPSAYVRVNGGNSGVITQNTGSRFITDPIITVTENSVTVVALGTEQAPIDTSYSTLFTLRLTAYKPAVGGGGMPQGARADFIWDPFTSQIVDDSNIDSIIFGSGFIQRRTTPVLPTLDTVKISLPPITVSRDSTFDVPVIFDMTSGSNVEHFAFSFDFDSSVVRFDDAFLASDIQGTLTKVTQPIHGDVFVESKDENTSFGSDTLFYLRFTSRGRTDTICTALSQVGFLTVNGDAKVDTRLITTGDMCVQGFVPATEAVEEYEGLRDLFISPNPASEIVTISLPEQKGRFSVAIFDAAGHFVHTAAGVGRIEWRPELAAAGAYYVIVTLDGHSVRRHVIIR